MILIDLPDELYPFERLNFRWLVCSLNANYKKEGKWKLEI